MARTGTVSMQQLGVYTTQRLKQQILLVSMHWTLAHLPMYQTLR
jgi:hypothetical protein